MGQNSSCRRLLLVFLTVVSFIGCGGSKYPEGGAASPEVLVRESLKNIGTILAQSSSAMMGMTGEFPSIQVIATQRAWNCPANLHYENDCLKMEGACSATGPRLNFSGTAEFKECLRETGLGLAAFSGAFNYSIAWDMPPSCVPSTENASCLSAMVDLSLSNPSNLSVRFAESDLLAITALQAGLEERWRLAGAGLWRLVLNEFSAFSGGQVFQCTGEPLACTVTAVTPANPPPAVDPACLDIPDCDSDAVCAAFVQSCPDTADLLGKFGYELRCLDSQSRNVRTCLPVKIATPPDDGGGTPPTQGTCSRSGVWNNFCPVTFGTTVNGEGLDCQADAECQSRDFSTFN
ncbi:MAG: hypothetical protein K8R69_03155, partial [Deltaproteobacteria bacterium]|nr:hypothetical protein [Deltaproteobacteria bacterium]